MTQELLRRVCLSAALGAMACAWSGAGWTVSHHVSSHAPHHRPDPLVAVRKFVTTFTQRQPADTQVDVSLVDEVPPRQWSGPGAFQAWTTSIQQTTGGAETSVTLHGSARTDLHMAYVIAPVLYSYQRRGAVVVEPATLAISMKRDAYGWRITGWAWAGVNPQSTEQTAATGRYLPSG
ncbi:MAG TPA: hypothetical protein VGF33_09895 [Caulobacteraceae bacterium]|jgi:hypothetical protein